MPLFSLPNELLLQIAEYLTLESDINSFSQLNHRLHALLNETLYTHNIKHSSSSALIYAAQHNLLPTTARLLSLGASVQTTHTITHDNSFQNTGRTPLSYASQNGHHAIAQLLLSQASIEPDKQCFSHVETYDETGAAKAFVCGRTPLSFAAENGHAEVVRLLLRTGKVDVNFKRNAQQRSPLSYAAGSGSLETVKLLLGEEDVVVDAWDLTTCRTPLNHAVEKGHLGIVRALLYADATVDVESLCIASANNYTRILTLLLWRGQGAERSLRLDPNQSFLRHSRVTPLMLAAERGCLECVDALLATGAFTPKQGAEGPVECVSVALAAENGHDEVVEALCRAGLCAPANRQSSVRRLRSWWEVEKRKRRGEDGAGRKSLRQTEGSENAKGATNGNTEIEAKTLYHSAWWMAKKSQSSNVRTNTLGCLTEVSLRIRR